MNAMPTRWARSAVELAVRILPAGASRRRYRQEFLAELHGMPRAVQLQHVIGLLVRAPALRIAVATPFRPGKTVAEGPPAGRRLTLLLLCGTGFAHRWRSRFTDDGERYTRCARCGKDATFHDVRATPGRR